MNDAINQTLSRTVLTALTVFLSTAILLFFGGKTLEDFAFVLFVGRHHRHLLHDLHRRRASSWTGRTHVEGRVATREKSGGESLKARVKSYDYTEG